MKKFLMLTVALAAAGLVRAQITPIDSTNSVGFISVPVTATGGGLDIIAVPFEGCLGSLGMLSDLVSTNGLVCSDTAGTADQLIVLTTNAAGPIYYYYWAKAGTGWETNKTTVLGGTTTNVVSPAATNFSIARGMGFWIKRVGTVPEGLTNLYMKGQIPISSQAIELRGNTNLTLISLGNLDPIALNDATINWGTRYPGNGFAEMDKLLVVTNANGAYVEYFYHTNDGGKWYTHSPLAQVTVINNPGYGFWYVRRSTNNLTFTPVVP